MSERRQVALGPAQETLLIPLYGRARETGKRRAVLRDPRAVEMVASLDYDFARLGRGPSMLGSVLRGEIVDGWVRRFLREHPHGTVVEIGAGLNTRYERLDNGRARWLEFDLPDAMALRRGFFADTERRTLLDASVLEGTWVDAALELPGPHCLISEAVLIYVSGDEVRDVLATVGRRFAGGLLVTDLWNRAGIESIERHDTMSRMSARWDWSCEDPAEIDGWGCGLRWLEGRRVTDPPRDVRRRMGAPMRWMLPLIDRTPPARRYSVDLFAVDGLGTP